MNHSHGTLRDAETARLPVPPDECWVILLWDPDGNDTSPWSVTAQSKDEAIRKAIADWHWSLSEGSLEIQPHPAPDVFKVYCNSWIGERVCHPT